MSFRHLALFLPLLGACAVDGDPARGTRGEVSVPDDGALVGVSMQSRVGVLLDEMPSGIRARVARDLVAKPAQFWIDRAKAQARLATYRLVFRQYFYGGHKKQLPLPPENLWNVTLLGAPRRVTEGGHDTVVVDYRLNTTLLTDYESPATSEAKLEKVGGVWNEPFVFPVDPELLFQRTGYACMDEEDFPFNTVDSEEVDTYYDQDCGVERELSNTGCHQTGLPTESCVDALRNHVGSVSTQMRFERLAWNPQTADAVRVAPPTTEGADMEVYLDDFLINRVEYKYFEPNSCEMQEQCIGAPGWRRVLQFNSSDQNRGATTLDIGPVDYYLTGDVTLNDQYNIFDFHGCHQHYHFTHYGSFSYDAEGANENFKQGFCLQSTNRAANHERSPLHNPYAGCDYQGVAAGWVDQYKIGLPCQWVDVTDVDTSSGPVTAPLTFTSNPDGFLCEGTPVLDAEGNPVFEQTEFTSNGETVWRPVCDFEPGWDENNEHSYDATVPVAGETYVTQACTRGQIGPLRNCGWRKRRDRIECEPGQTTRVRCTVSGRNAAPQVARLCHYSDVLGTGMACSHEDQLASGVIDGSGELTFTCPDQRGSDREEPGGAFSLYTGAAYPGDASASLDCIVVP